MRVWRSVSMSLGALLLAANSLAATTQLRIHGSNTVGAELMPVLAEAWLKSKGFSNVSRKETGLDELQLSATNAAGDQMSIEINSHGSSTAFSDLGKGATDIGMASRPI